MKRSVSFWVKNARNLCVHEHSFRKIFIRQNTIRPLTYKLDFFPKVFEAEKVLTSSGMFHRPCFKCAECGSGLDATKVCENAQNREVYCAKCYGKVVGLHGYGHGGFGSIPALTAGGNETKSEYHFTQFFWEIHEMERLVRFIFTSLLYLMLTEQTRFVPIRNVKSIFKHRYWSPWYAHFSLSYAGWELAS